MSEVKIVVRRRYQHNNRATSRPTTVNVAIATHQKIKALKARTGLNYDEIVGMAIDLLDKRIEVKP